MRLILALYALLLRLLPRDFRARWLADAETDLEDAVKHAAGPLDRLRTGAGAVWDVLGAIPREWWRAARRSPPGRSRDPRWATEEAVMRVVGEVRLASRALRRRPGFSLAAAATLALGIGATVSIFSVVNAVLLRPLPYEGADELVVLRHHAPGLNLPELNNSPGTLRLYRDHADFLTSVAAYDVQSRNLVGGARPERVEVLAATPELFDVLRVAPALGRALTADDADPGTAPVALLTHAAWTARFGGDPAAVGRTLEVDGATTEIVGVMPAGFGFPDGEPVLVSPMYVDPDGPFGSFGTSSVARLTRGVTVEDAGRRATQLQSLLPEIAGDDIDASFLDRAGWSVTVQRLQDWFVGDEVASAIWVVFGTVALVLLIACANVGGLFLVRAEARQREVAVRSAIGAGVGRIASLFLAEALVLGLIGGAAGLLLATGAVEVLVARAPEGVPRLDEASVDGAALLFAAGASLTAALVFGSIPLFGYLPRGLAGVLRGDDRGATSGRARHRARSSLVAGQLALGLVLLVASGLMVRTFAELRAVDPGFDPSGVTRVGLSLGEDVADPEGAAFYQRVADAVAALPGVTDVGITTLVPLGDGETNGGSFYIESRPRVEDELPPVALYKAIGAEYLATVRQQLIAGRTLERSDWEGGAPVALVNETFAETFLDGAALGEGIKWDESKEYATVVGVVADAREMDLREEPGAWAYLPLVVGEWGYPNMDAAALLVRAADGAPASAAAIRTVVERLDPTVPLTDVGTLDEVVARQAADTSFTLALLAIAAGMALFLGAVGLFGVVTYVVGHRTREIGVRVALGARGHDIEAMVLRQGAGVVVAGLSLGLAASFALSRLMASLLYGVSALDPTTFVAAPLVLGAVALGAGWMPARRAARIAPVEALRTD